MLMTSPQLQEVSRSFIEEEETALGMVEGEGGGLRLNVTEN